MKRFGYMLIFTVVMTAVVGCGGSPKPPVQPSEAQNPYEDDYRDVAGYDSRSSWGTYNIHDPVVRKFGDVYYAYSTDAIWWPPKKDGDTQNNKIPKIGNIQIRKSKDLVSWEFKGWAFDSIPQEAWDFVYPISKEKTSRGLWAPYVLEHNGIYRMYYCLSTFGEKVSFIGLAESKLPEGPWTPKGCVVKTDSTSVMNAIDPTVVDDVQSGKQWMVYGSFFGGIFAVELNKETGLAKTEGDQGHLVAHRANYMVDNMEAPECVYNPETKKYYLFVSYGPLVTTYNVRVSIADNPEGPYKDYFGVDPRGEVNTLPVLTAPYRFENHGGWAGLAHCTVFNDGNGKWFLASQGRLSPENMLMDFHIRRLFFRSDGWPMVSPERYAGEEERPLCESEIYGEYEFITIKDNYVEKDLGGTGQSNILLEEEVNKSVKLSLDKNNVKNYKDNSFTLVSFGEEIPEIKIFVGHDWENKKTTLLFTGINKDGFSVWGKKIK